MTSINWKIGRKDADTIVKIAKRAESAGLNAGPRIGGAVRLWPRCAGHRAPHQPGQRQAGGLLCAEIRRIARTN